MEDEALIQSDLVGVFDGHGGASVSRYVRQNLYGHIQAILPRVLQDRKEQEEKENGVATTNSRTTPQDYETTLRRALEQINKDVFRIVHWSYQGSTVAVCWLHEAPRSATTKDGDDNDATNNDNDEKAAEDKDDMVRTLVAANIGDSRLVLSRNGEAIALSRDHKPDDPIEMEFCGR